MQIERHGSIKLSRLPTPQYFLCRTRELFEPLWMKLGALESHLLRARLQQQPIDRPIYVTGLARAGTTVTLTMLGEHQDLATHRYRDMVQPYLPFSWNWLADRLPLPMEEPQERVHQDGILVTSESPEAVEEALWNRFFPHLHDESTPAVLDAATSHPAFEAYYKATIGKLLVARKRSRYLSKANYNLTRLAYLARLFPQARFIVMTREPASHFASWLKQHELFLQTQEHDPRWHRTIRMVGHSEFGRDQRFVNAGDTELTATIRAEWDAGNRARAFGLYWSAMYGQVLNLIERDARVRNAALFVRYEDLCAKPHETIDRMLEHTQLSSSGFEAVRDRYAMQLVAPKYYRARFDDAELMMLQQATQDVAGRLGYP